MNKNGRTLSEDIKLIRRGMTEFGTFLPGQLKLLFIHSLITMTIPYIGIYMTSAIISELSGSKRVTMLMTRTGTSLVLILVLTIIAALLNKKISVGYNQLFPAHEIRLNEKANAMKYSLLENEKVRALRDEVSGSIDCSGAGMGSLYWDCGSIFNAIISGMISITILVSGFGIKGTPINAAPSPLGIADSLWGYLILIVVIAVSAAVSCKMTSKIFDVSFDVFLNGAKYNRYSNYYKLEYLSDDKSAKDVRLYSQKDLILNEVLDKCYIPFAEGDKREKDASSRGNGVLLLLSAITGGVVYILIGAKAIHGSIGIGNVLLIYVAVTMLIKALTDFAMTFTDLRNNNEHLIRYFDYVSMDEESSSEKTTPEFLKGEVSVNNLSFKYPGTKAYALRDISLSIKRLDAHSGTSSLYYLLHHLKYIFSYAIHASIRKTKVHLFVAPCRTTDVVLIKACSDCRVPLKSILRSCLFDNSILSTVKCYISLLGNSYGFLHVLLKILNSELLIGITNLHFFRSVAKLSKSIIIILTIC